MPFIEIKTNKKLYYIECKYLEQSEFDIIIDCITATKERRKFIFMLSSNEFSETEFFQEGTKEVLEYIKKENGEFLFKQQSCKK